MSLIEILRKKEYILFLAIIFTNIRIITNCFDAISYKPLKILFKFDLFIIIFYYFYCIFLENEFDSTFLKIWQIKLERKLLMSFIALIVLICSMINVFLGEFFFSRYLYYKKYCPFTFKELDYKLHLKRRCELYNINNKSIFPFQYICNYDESKFNIFNKEFFEIYKISIYSEIKCSKVENLLINNKVIDEFVNEYYREDLFYCDLEKQIEKFSDSINPKKCTAIPSSTDKFIVFHLFLSIIFWFKIISYFKDIKANIIVKPSYSHIKQN